MHDDGIIPHPRLRPLALSMLIVLPFMAAIASYAAVWGWFRLHLTILSVVVIIAGNATAAAVLVRVVYALSTDFGVRVDDQGVQVIMRRVFGPPVSDGISRWEDLGEPYLLSRLWREIAVPTRGALLTLSAYQAKLVLNDRRWPGSRKFPIEVHLLIESAKPAG